MLSGQATLALMDDIAKPFYACWVEACVAFLQWPTHAKLLKGIIESPNAYCLVALVCHIRLHAMLQG